VTAGERLRPLPLFRRDVSVESEPTQGVGTVSTRAKLQITAIALIAITCCSVSAQQPGPLVPSNPNPPNDGTLDPSTQDFLMWEGGHSLEGWPVEYDVLLGEVGALQPVAYGLTEEKYAPGELEPNTVYEWQIIARDRANRITVGPIWRFTYAQWIKAEFSGTQLSLRVLGEGRFAARLATVRVASNAPVGLRFGAEIDDSAAGDATIPTWYTFGMTLDDALSSLSWVRASELAGREFPAVFPTSDEGTAVEIWVMVEVTADTPTADAASNFSLTLTQDGP